MSPDLLKEAIATRLEEHYPDRFAGLRDSDTLQSFLDDEYQRYRSLLDELQTANPEANALILEDQAFHQILPPENPNADLDEITDRYEERTSR